MKVRDVRGEYGARNRWDDGYRDDRRDGYHYDRRDEERDGRRRHDYKNQWSDYSDGGRRSHHRGRQDDSRFHRDDRGRGPSRQQVEDFLYDNGIDNAASNDFRGCPQDVQRIVMDQGSLVSAQKPSGALIIRIKKARIDCGSVYRPQELAPPRVNRYDTQNRGDYSNDRRFDDRARSRTRSPIRRTSERQESHRTAPQDNLCVTVEGIPDDMDSQELKDMVQEFGPSVKSTRTYKRGKTNCATIEFGKLADAERVVAEMDERLIEGENGRLRAYFSDRSGDS